MPVEPGSTTASAAAVATAASAALPPDCSTAIPAIVASGWLEATTPLVDRIGERRDSHRIGCSYTLPIYTVPERIQGVSARSQDLTQAPELHLAGPALTPSLLVMDPSALSSDGLLFGRLFGVARDADRSYLRPEQRAAGGTPPNQGRVPRGRPASGTTRQAHTREEVKLYEAARKRGFWLC